MERKIQSTASRWSIAAAVFGGVCNLLCWFLSNYQSYYLERDQLVWSYSFIFIEGILLAPLFALVVFRHFMPVIFIYDFLLFSILSWRVCHLVRYQFFGGSAGFYKIDMPGLLLVFLGVISAAVVLVRSAFYFSGIMRLKRSESAS
jgi:hypothetical protein